MEIGVRVIGERRVALRFEQFPQTAKDNLLEVVTNYQSQLQTEVQDRLPRRTGGISDSLTGGVENQATKVRGWVNLGGKDSNLIRKIAALEYGASGSVKVKAKDSRGLRTVYGHYITPMNVAISAYDRQANIIAQRFLRDPLAQIANPFLDAAEQAVRKATEAG